MITKYILNRTGLRNVMLILGQIDLYSNRPGQFTPYFEYEIGDHQDNYKLYFRKLPSTLKYYNYIFLKLWSYKAHDAIKYLEYHYEMYPDKKDFLLFVQRDLEQRENSLKGTRLNKTWQGITQISLKWANEKLKYFDNPPMAITLNQFTRNDLTIIIKNELQNTIVQPTTDNTPAVQPPILPHENQSIDQFANNICDRIEERLIQMLDNTDHKLGAITERYEMGKIQLTNKNTEDKLAKLLIVLKNLRGKTSRNGKPGDLLFSKMDLTDIAQILRLHFEHHKGKSLDGVERPLYKLNSDLDWVNDPALRELDKALQKFFFEA